MEHNSNHRETSMPTYPHWHDTCPTRLSTPERRGQPQSSPSYSMSLGKAHGSQKQTSSIYPMAKHPEQITYKTKHHNIKIPDRFLPFPYHNPVDSARNTPPSPPYQSIQTRTPPQPVIMKSPIIPPTEQIH